MQVSRVTIRAAPAMLAPALRLVEPTLLGPSRQPPLPWAPGQPSDPVTPVIDPAVQKLLNHLVHAAVEVLRGRRPASHLERHASAQVCTLLGRLQQSTPLPGLRLASSRLAQPAADRVEVAIRLQLGANSRAAALGFRHGTGWRLTGFEIALEPQVVLRAD